MPDIRSLAPVTAFGGGIAALQLTVSAGLARLRQPCGRRIGDAVDLILDGGACQVGVNQLLLI